MLEVRALLNMVLGAFQNLTTNPSLDALAAYLFTTAVIFVGIPGLLGVFMGKDWFAPAFKFWGKWLVAAPFVAFAAIILYVVHYPARAIEEAANRRWVYREHFRGNIIAFGMNAVAWFVYWVARLLAELSGFGIANLPRGARAAAPAHH